MSGTWGGRRGPKSRVRIPPTLGDVNRAPDGATHFHLGMFYKRGRHGFVYYWSGGDWLRSTMKNVPGGAFEIRRARSAA